MSPCSRCRKRPIGRGARGLCPPCYSTWHRQENGRKTFERECTHCQKTFTSQSAFAHFCSTGAGSCEALSKAGGSLPNYGAKLHPRLRNSPLFNPQREPTASEIFAYKRALRRDPCSYCGGHGGSHDHIVPCSAGIEDVRDWRNLAGSCRRCNSTKQALPLLRALLWIPISRAYHDMRPLLFPRKKAAQAAA